MRIISILLIIGIYVSIVVATKTPRKEKPTSISTPTNKTTKSSKKPGDDRGKRTLSNLGYPGFSYSVDFANRRQGYEDPRSFYSQDGLYNGQSAIGQYSFPDTSNHLPDYNQFSQFPQYLEAPEPIIEIIIKDSNETIATQSPQPLVQKKKKEKVHVYYVKYKKDENNKLQLEEPIASLNNNEHEAAEEEEEEIVHYPTIVTPIPPLKTTTLRTIIHPDSEKFHSNSGIHVTFGSEDKAQAGHELQEHNAESVQRSVVALPQGGSFPPRPAPTANVRADFGDPRGSIAADGYQGFQGGYYQNQNTQPDYKPSITQQQLPEPQALTAFRPQPPQSQPQQPQQHQQQQQHHQQQQYPQQQQQYPQQQQQQYSQQQHQQHQQHQQQNQQQQHHQQQQYPQQQHQQPQQQRPFFNQGPPNPQDQAPKPYQRPSAPVAHTPTQYQTYPHQNVYQQQQIQFNQPPQQQQPILQPKPQPQQSHQQQYQPQQQQQPILPPKQPLLSQQYQKPQQRPNAQPLKQNIFFTTPPSKTQDLPSRQSPSSYQPVKFRPTTVPNSVKFESANHPPLAQLQPYSRPQSFGQKPSFSAQSQGPAYDTVNRYQKPQPQKSPSPRPEQNYNPQQIPYNHKPQPQANSFTQNSSPNLSQLHSLFDVKPSKETELLRAIPKFEQHIIETSDGNRFNSYSSYSGGNQAIHDIPAPNLGPTTPSPSQSNTYNPNNQYNSDSGAYRQQFNSFVTSPSSIQYQSSTPAPQYVKTNDGQQLQIVTPMPSTDYYNQHQQPQSQFISSGSQPQIIPNSQPKQQAFYQQQPRQSEASQFSVSTLHSDVFKELEYRKNSLTTENVNIQPKNNFKNYVTEQKSTTTPAAPSTTSKNAAKAQLELPDEVPDDLRQQLLSSGILDNADISVLDYDKVGDVNLENLPAEHLQHFYGAGGGAQISESNKVLTVVKPNGESVNFSEKAIEKVKETRRLPQKQNVELKVVQFNANNEKSLTNKYIKSDSTVVPPIDLADRQYNRYLPLKINGAQFPIPDVDELRGKKVASVVVLAPVDNLQALNSDQLDDGRSERDTTESKEVKFVTGDIIKTLIKKPTKENFKKWLEKESRSEVDSQSVVLLVAKSPVDGQEIFMYDIATGAVNKLNGELSSAFVNVAEENASAENLDHASTLDPSILETMMEKTTKV